MRQRITRRRGVIEFAALVGALVALPCGVIAQQAAVGAPPAAPAAAVNLIGTTGDVGTLAEEIAVLRAVKPLKPTPDQLTGLATAVT